MQGPTNDQNAVLRDASRIRVVRAVPGSGKTWLVAEIIRREMHDWSRRHAGIAALSFTHVGGNEIRAATGHDLPAPHFVGTIDAFLYRFILRPFARKVWPSLPELKLVPAEWEPNLWTRGGSGAIFSVTLGTGKKARRVSLLESYILGTENGKLLIGYRPDKWSPIEIADDTTATMIRNAKKELWKNHGYITHSDVAYLASHVLSHKTLAAIVRSEVIRRFPLLIVDELQDTGWSLGQCILKLLNDPDLRGVLVGDPDQAIYEFNGAKPELFPQFESIAGAKKFELATTRRCNDRVCEIAGHFSSTGRAMTSTIAATGTPLIISYKDIAIEIPNILTHLSHTANGRTVKLIARHHKTLDKIRGVKAKVPEALGSTPMNLLQKASLNLRRGRNDAAFTAAQSAISSAIFDCEYLTDDELRVRRVEPSQWKNASIRILLEAARDLDGETFEVWGNRLRTYVRQQLSPILPVDTNGASIFKELRRPGSGIKKQVRRDFLPSVVVRNPFPGIVIDTVHGVKGETHDVTVFLCPKAHGVANCLSTTWWPTGATKLEERRIAFVAMTRTRADLIVCIHESSLERLRASQAAFVACFDVITTGDYLAAISNPATTGTSGDSAGSSA